MKNFKKIFSIATSVVLATSVAFGAMACGNNDEEWTPPQNTYEYNIPQDYCRTYYEIFVRSFSDSDGDGIGDIRGIINNLDYLNDGDDSTMTDLGINGIWLMPINPTMSYHGYDVTNYKNINPDYGTLDDFKDLIEACNERGIWVQMDLVLNHTSNAHPWFTKALAEARTGVAVEDSTYMKRYEFYRKGDEPAGGKYADAAGGYRYLCNFDKGMPDLNLVDMETNGLKEEIEDIIDFWLELGVRSFRLDAVPWACANKVTYNAANGKFWTWLNDYCNEKGAEVFGSPDDGIERYCYNVGEVLETSGGVVEEYFSTGMSNFNYSMGGSTNNVFARLPMGYYFAGAAQYVADIGNMQSRVLSRDPNALLSNFLSNHDNARSAGYYMYDPTKIKVAAGIYLLAPGNPYIYYGEEIGAEGRKLNNDTDANVRMAFNWGDNSRGITGNPPGTDYTDGQRLGSWQSQTNNKDSVLTYYRNAIRLRNRFPEIGRGVLTPYAANEAGVLVKSSTMTPGTYLTVNQVNMNVAAYTLEWKGSTVLIIQNIGDSSVSLNMESFPGYEVVGELEANGGSVNLNNGTLNMSAATVAVLKVAA